MTPHELLEDLKKPDGNCPNCGVSNNCMVAAGKSGSACWCFSEEISEDITSSTCYCKECLKGVQ